LREGSFEIIPEHGFFLMMATNKNYSTSLHATTQYELMAGAITGLGDVDQ
jgi:hypothetical protein